MDLNQPPYIGKARINLQLFCVLVCKEFVANSFVSPGVRDINGWHPRKLFPIRCITAIPFQRSLKGVSLIVEGLMSRIKKIVLQKVA
jgi:hypothetical protein